MENKDLNKGIKKHDPHDEKGNMAQPHTINNGMGMQFVRLLKRP